MMTFAYGAVFEPGEEAGIVVTFPDVPEAITEGKNVADAREMAADALGVALLTYVELGRALPEAAARTAEPITVDAEIAAKLAVIEAFREAGLSKSELARRLDKDEREVRRILDPSHATKLPALKAALAALGRRLVIGVERLPIEVRAA